MRLMLWDRPHARGLAVGTSRRWTGSAWRAGPQERSRGLRVKRQDLPARRGYRMTADHLHRLRLAPDPQFAGRRGPHFRNEAFQHPALVYRTDLRADQGDQPRRVGGVFDLEQLIVDAPPAELAAQHFLPAEH